jgi:hypothetical protein
MSHAKPVDERAGHRGTPAVLSAGALVVPTYPGELPDSMRSLWDALWTSPVAAVLDPVSDRQPVTRLFKLYKRDRQFDEALDRQIERLSDGEPDAVFDPQLARLRLAIAAEIRQLEQTLGITPRGRLVIGAAVAAVGKATEQEHDDADD